MGVGVALDDFGAGYSSLAYLSHFAWPELKIDRGFIVDRLSRRPEELDHRGCNPGPGARPGPARGGRRQPGDGGSALLAAAGCDALQGYLFSPPVAPAALGALIDRFAPAERYAKPRVVAIGA